VLGTANIAAGNLIVSANGAITQVANTALTIGGSATFTATNGALTLDKANAFTGAVSLTNSGSNSNVALNNNRALVLGSASVSGNLTVTANGSITQVASTSLTVAGTASFSATNGAMTLNQANTFSSPVALSNTGANNVTLSYNGDLQLGVVSVASGNLAV